MIELYYGRLSIASEKVLICLFERQIPFTGHFVNLMRFGQVDPAYLAINPGGVLPTMLVDGRPIFESSIINEYLNETGAGPALLPADPMARAEARLLVQRCGEIFHPSLATLSQKALFADEFRRHYTPDELRRLVMLKPNPERRARQLQAIESGVPDAELAAAEARILALLDRMEAILSDRQDWFFGTYSLADIAAAPNFARVEKLGLTRFLEGRPRLAAWWDRMRTRPAYLRTYQ